MVRFLPMKNYFLRVCDCATFSCFYFDYYVNMSSKKVLFHELIMEPVLSMFPQSFAEQN